MSIITIPIGKKIYQLDVDDESKSEILNLSRQMNKKINSMYIQYPDLDHEHIIILQSLILISQLKQEVSTGEIHQKSEYSDEIKSKIIELEKKILNLSSYFASI